MAAFKSLYEANTHILKESQSLHERHTEALFLADGVRAHEVAKEMLREVSHIHQKKDYSVHVGLAPQDGQYTPYRFSPVQLSSFLKHYF